MARRRNTVMKEEYEVLDYPKLNHVAAGVVHIVNRTAHAHRAMEIGLVLAGGGVVRVNEKEFAIQEGSIFFINANEPHQITASGQDGVRIGYLDVADAFCNEYFPYFRNLELPENNISDILPPEELRELTELMVDVLTNYLSEYSAMYALHCIGSICLLYGKLLSLITYRRMPDTGSLPRTKRMARLSRITEYIETNYMKKITLGQLAELENVSTTYLSRFIHDHLHMTFQEYISSVRFEHALRLLRDTSLSKTDICAACGFSDVKYLSKMLEEHFEKPAWECYHDLRGEGRLLREFDQTQTCVAEETGLGWIEDFRNKYML